MSLPPNRTPFDDDLVTPNAPRHTQPLPAQQPSSVPNTPPGAQSSTGSPLPPTLPSGPSTVPGAPPLPRQVIPGDDDAPAKTTTLSARRVPMSVIVGLAAVGGAIGVVMLSGAFGRLAPRPDSPGVITAEQEQARAANQDATGKSTPTAPRVAVAAPRTSTPAAANPAANQKGLDSTNSNVSKSDAANSSDTSPNSDALPNDAPTPDIVVQNDQSERNVRPRSNRNAASASRDTNDTSGNDSPNSDLSNSDSRNSDSSGSDRTDSRTPRNEDLSSSGNASGNSSASGADNAGNRRDNEKNNAGQNSDVPDAGTTSARGIEYSNGGAKPRYIERKRSYSIRPPSGFEISQRGRRTVWQGPGKSQFLVEVGDANGESPRAGWEELERGLQRKYGSRYRSHGIRDTTINGRDAAIWEFELQTPKGRVRKMDVAVHNGKNGYAVLGSAPAADFENYRPGFERAIRSLQIESNKGNDNGNNGSNGNDNGQTDSSATAEGY
jgi:hypothetical protein